MYAKHSITLHYRKYTGYACVPDSLSTRSKWKKAAKTQWEYSRMYAHGLGNAVLGHITYGLDKRSDT